MSRYEPRTLSDPHDYFFLRKTRLAPRKSKNIIQTILSLCFLEIFSEDAAYITDVM